VIEWDHSIFLVNNPAESNRLKNPLDISVRHRLVLGLSILSVLTLCATAIAAVTFFSHREKLHQVVKTEVPTLLLAAELAHAGEAIASGVAPIATAQNFLQAETVSGEILDKFAWMDRLISDLNQLGADRSYVEQFRLERAKIQDNFLQLQANVNTYWHVKSRNAVRRKELQALLNSEAKMAVEQSSDGLGRMGLSSIEQAAALRFSQAITALTATEISQAKLELSKLKDVIKDYANKASSRHLIDSSRRIVALSTTAANFLADRAEEKALANKTFSIVAYHKHLSDRLTTALSNLLLQRKAAIGMATLQAEDALTISSILLALLAALSIVLVAAVAMILDRSISGRLRNLQNSMKLIASGERSVEINETGKDEIGEMGRSLSTFVKTLKHQQQALRIAKNEAVSANRAKSLFLANVSHELRTPLNAILGFSEIIRTGALGPVQPVRYGEYANDIHESGQHLLDLINDVLDMAKIEAGRTELRESNINISSVVHDSLRIVSQLAKEAHIELETDMSPALPSLWADTRMLVQMCTNLIENAIDFSPPGSTISVSAKVNELGQFLVCVVDRGMGMSPSEVTRALNPLEREDIDSTREKDGTGLGLPLIAQYIDLHGGEISIDSQPGKGTTVTISFPAERVRVATDRKFTVIDGKN
jgi:signal transduction histidine kinase